jgi:hypothetical protein
METMRYTMRLEKTRLRGKEGSALQPTERRSYSGGDHVQNALSYLAAVQMHERFLCNVKASAGSVNGSDDDGHARRRVGQAPAPAAVGRVPHDVEGATDVRERRDIAERRESPGQAIRTVRARNVVERAVLVVVRGVEGRFKGGRGRRRLRGAAVAAGLERGHVGIRRHGCGWVRLFGRRVRGR